MKPAHAFSNYIEFARCACEGIADLNEDVTGLSEMAGDESVGYIPKAIPLSESDRSDFDWLALTLYYVFTLFCEGDAKYYGRVLKELETVKLKNKSGNFLL